MTGPALSAHYAARQPSVIRVSQIRFAQRTDGASAINVAIGNVSLPMHPAMVDRLGRLRDEGSPFADGVVKYTATVGLAETHEAFLNIIASSGFSTDGLHCQVTDGGSQGMELVILGVCGPAGGTERPLLLIVPPAHGSHGPVFPRGVTSIASFLRERGVPAEVLPLGHVVNDFAGRSQALAATRAAVTEALERLDPRAVGLSIPFSYLYPRALEIADIVRDLAPELPIIAGGPHVTFQDRVCLEECPAIDVVVRGEGEWTALDLMDAFARGRDLGGVPGITWRTPSGGVQRNGNRTLGDIDTLPPVDFGLLPRSFCERMEVAAITSRGCSYRCRFCHERGFWSGRVRAHSPERIAAEGDRLARDYDNPFRGVDDSMLDMRSPYFHRLVELLGQRDWLRLSFGFLTRLDTIVPEGLEAMVRNRIRVMSVGAESGSQAVLDAMGKDLSIETMLRALAMTRDAGVGVNGFFIVGHPGDTPDRAAESRAFIDRLFEQRMVQWIDLSIFTPYPGTPFWKNPDHYGLEILSRDWSLWRRSNRPIVQLEGYSASAIYLDYLRLLRLQKSWLERM